ncbi:hypothetical protein Mame_05133 (plasmid) [Martelella mediterranea DSM 17316]|uniref:Uncharacterized protein n=1 Tax=Martelella mediterranea DSM 17316 TaxID=1122214 RepID=A0A1U9Z9Q6_9HYPH|nr:hypothetical protein Mame_05133 [Martelella mediterranea DSM 17316]
MSYEIATLPISGLMEPAFRAGIALARLDERIARSPVGAGFLERQHFADACASLWIDGELVHLETSSSTTLFAIPARRPTNSPSPATCCSPAGGFRASLLIGHYRLTACARCDRFRRSPRPTRARRRWSAPSARQSRSRPCPIRKGRGRVTEMRRICPTSTMPPSMRRWPIVGRNRGRYTSAPHRRPCDGQQPRKGSDDL